MIVTAKRLLTLLALGTMTLTVSACCGGKSTNVAATTKCQASSISAENCKNCCKAYGSNGYSYVGRNTCTCR